MATAESPGLSQNDSSESLAVTPKTQEIPDLIAWIVFCSRMLLGVNDVTASDYSLSTRLKQSDWRENHAQDHKGTVRSEETKEVSPRIMGLPLCRALCDFPEKSKTDLVIFIWLSRRSRSRFSTDNMPPVFDTELEGKKDNGCICPRCHDRIPEQFYCRGCGYVPNWRQSVHDEDDRRKEAA